MIYWSPTRPADHEMIDMRVDAPVPWCRFHLAYQHGHIPIPQMPGHSSESVQGIVEGLALVARSGQPGKINPGYFMGPGRPRRIQKGQWCVGYRVGTRAVSIGEARQNLLMPAYLWVLHNRLKAFVKRLDQMGRDKDLHLYDGASNIDIHDPKPFSGAAVVVSLINGTLRQFERGDTEHLLPH